MVPAARDRSRPTDRQKKRVLIALVTIIAGGVVFASNSYAADRYSTSARSGVSSPVESRHAPVASRRQDGLVRSPSESSYQERDLAIPWEVAEGRYSHREAWYNSPLGLQGPRGSTSRNSFMRRSAQTPYDATLSERPQPHYFSRWTGTSLGRGTDSGSASQQILSQKRLSQYETVPKGIFQGSQVIGNSIFGKRRPYALHYDEIARQVAKQIKDGDLNLTDELLYDQDRAAKIKKMIRELELSEIKKTAKDRFSKLRDRLPEVPKPGEIQQPILTQEQKEKELLKQAEPMTLKEKGIEQKTRELTEFIEKELGISPRSLQDDIEDKTEKTEKFTRKTKPQKKNEPTFAEQVMTIPPDHELAKKLLGDHKDFESLAREKFARYQELAGNFMKQGKYYEAINSWDLAEIWISNHPDSSMGRGHALFAAGEYMSSVHYIEKALSFSEWYAAQKTDLLELMDHTVFSENMVELEDIYKRSKSYRLGFLLAYLDYQAQRIDKSAKYLTAIEDKMIQNQAYQNLKKAVDKAATREGSK